MADSAKSLTPILSEEEFLPLVKRRSQGLVSALALLTGERVADNKMRYFTLLLEAERLEGFLDDHGARTNARWRYFTELVASARNFAIAGFHLSHLLGRYDDYLKNGSDKLKEDFLGQIQDTLDYFTTIFLRFLNEIAEEADGHPAAVFSDSDKTADLSRAINPKLPHTISSEEAFGEEERMISIAQAYRRVYKDFQKKRLNRKVKAKTLPELIPNVVNETMLAQMESALHTIQSEFDTYIRGGGLYQNDSNVGALRGLTAVPMHLFESLRWLVHFFERHEGEIRKSELKTRVSELVNDERLFTCITEFGLKYCNRYLSEGNRVAEKILSSFVRPVALKLPIPKPLGFHARPSTYVSLIVQEHGTDVFMAIDDTRYDCRSVLEMLQVGGILADRGDDTVVFEGDQRTLSDIKILADHNYCEDQDIPVELQYLRIMRNL